MANALHLNGAARMPNGEHGGIPLWYRALDRFGVPTVVLCFVMAAFAYYFQAVREDSREFQKAFTAAMAQQNDTLGKLASEVKRLSDVQEQNALWKQITSGNQ